MLFFRSEFVFTNILHCSLLIQLFFHTNGLSESQVDSPEVIIRSEMALGAMCIVQHLTFYKQSDLTHTC